MIYIVKYEEFNGPNLAINYNHEYDFLTYQSKNFDGGDGISAMEIPKILKPKIDKPIQIKGNNAKKKQKERKDKKKRFSKESKIANFLEFQTDDIVTFATRREPSSDA